MASQLRNRLWQHQLRTLKFSVLQASQCKLYASCSRTHHCVDLFHVHAYHHKERCMKRQRKERCAQLLTSGTELLSRHLSLCPAHSFQKGCSQAKLQLLSQHVLSLTGPVCVRQSHHGSQTLWKSPLFLDFLKTLVSEYTELSENQSTETLDESQFLRLQFLKPVVSVLEKLQGKEEEKSELTKLLSEEEDKEMKSLLEKELEQLNEDVTEIGEELVDVLVGEEVADSNDIVLEVSAGVGGQEAMLFSAEVFEMYCNYALHKGWSVSELREDEAEMGGVRKASMQISGEDVYRHLKHEAGVHRVQRVPKTEKSGRMHTSTVTVAVVPKPREIDIVLDPKDLKVETMRGSGPGGQSVNTTDSAVRITHLPSGVMAECRQERSQIKNKDIAMEKLKMRMYQERLEEQEAKRKATRKMQMGTRGRSEKIRTYNFQQDRISDHRLKGNVNNIQEFLRGGEELDELIASLEVEEKYATVHSMLEDFELSLKESSKKR